MAQEFLASFAVDIDEAGVTRLQTILTQNRELANQLAAAFNTARSSMMDFIRSATEELSALPFFSRPSSVEETLGASGTFSVDLDFSKASKQLETFLASAKKQFKLTADGSGIISAASSALSQVRSMFSSAGLVLKVKTEVEKPGTSDDDSGDSSGLAFTPVRAATGGRFSSPTHAEIAEDGDPEYVVPVKKENEAVPLVRSLLSELSASARASLQDVLLPGASDNSPEQRDNLSKSPEQRDDLFQSTELEDRSQTKQESLFSAISSIPQMMSAAPTAAVPVVNQTTSSNVSAPVNIHVEASAADPVAVGHSIYNTAERYLLRTIQGATG